MAAGMDYCPACGFRGPLAWLMVDRQEAGRDIYKTKCPSCATVQLRRLRREEEEPTMSHQRWRWVPWAWGLGWAVLLWLLPAVGFGASWLEQTTITAYLGPPAHIWVTGDPPMPVQDQWEAIAREAACWVFTADDVKSGRFPITPPVTIELRVWVPAGGNRYVPETFFTLHLTEVGPCQPVPASRQHTL